MNPQDLNRICAAHGLHLLQSIEQGSETFTARVRDHTGRELVLKRLGEGVGEWVRAGLTAWAETGVTPRLVAALAPDLLLLEWIAGTSMAAAKTLPDAASIGRAVARLHRVPIPDAVPDVREPFPTLMDGWNALPVELQPLAASVTAAIEAAPPEPCVLLHGDLVPYNVILTEAEPRLIDPLPARGFSAWDLAKLVVAWRALGRSGILTPLLEGYGAAPPLLAELVTWIALVYLQKNMPHPKSPLRPHLLPMVDELRAARAPDAFLRCFHES